MYRLFRFVCPLALAVSLLAAPMTVALAKKSSADKHAKSKDRSKGKEKKGSKKSSRNERHAKNRKSRRDSEPVAKRSKPSPQPGEGGRERAGSTTSQTETPLTPNPARSGESANEPNSQEFTQPAPRAVISTIPVERVAEIQTALIKQGYLNGEASGIYDDSTKAAMKKFQTANNLQATGLPSAHALKRLGVGKRGNSLSQVQVKTKSDVEKEDHQ